MGVLAAENIVDELQRAATPTSVGAVYVVSGRVVGSTMTVPLRVEQLFQEIGHLQESFAVASILTLLSLATLVLKAALQRWAAADSPLPEADTVLPVQPELEEGTPADTRALAETSI